MAADLLIVNGRVFRGSGPADAAPPGSADGARPPEAPTAVAVRGERIAAIGSDDELVRDLRGPATQVVDARGGLVMAGFDDAHFHLVHGIRALDEIALAGAADLATIRERVLAAGAAMPGDGWLVGGGWVYGAVPGGMPTADMLDDITPARPVYLRCYDGHTGWANSLALRLAGIDRDTPDPPDGEIVRDAGGAPNGGLKEGATGLIEAVLPQPSFDADLRAARRAIRDLQAAGVTAVQDAWADAHAVELCRRLEGAGELGVRTRLAMRMEPEGSLEAWRRRLDEHEGLAARIRGGSWLDAGVLKGFADGVVESRTAAMLEPYDDNATHGRPNWDPGELAAHVREAHGRGWQVEVHAIGDAGVRMTLDAYERAGPAADVRDRRHRVEHIELIDAADLPRFARIGVVASMQPLHADPQPNLVEIWAANVGPERATRGFAWGALHRAGAVLAFGSDWPVVSYDPIAGLHAAVNRQTADGEPAGGWMASQRIGLADALAAYTRGSAWAAHAEHRRGTIAVGLDADLVVLDRDLLAEGPSAIIGTSVRLTVVGGRIVHRREDAP